MKVKLSVFQLLKFLIVATISLVTSACFSGANLSSTAPTLESPLPPSFQVPLLLENRWRLVSVVVDGKPLNYNSLGLVYISFHPDIISVRTTNCNDGGSRVTPMPDNTFRVGRGYSTFKGCGEEGNNQYDALMVEAIPSLTAYEIIDDSTVLLTGDNVTVKLEYAYALSLPLPFQDAMLAKNSWLLASVAVNGEPLDYRRIAPVFIYFDSQTSFTSLITGCKAGGDFDAIPLPDKTFRVELTRGPARSCGEEKDTQLNTVMEAMGKFTAYKSINESKILLTGNNVIAMLESNSP